MPLTHTITHYHTSHLANAGYYANDTCPARSRWLYLLERVEWRYTCGWI